MSRSTALIQPVHGVTRDELERRAADRYVCHQEATASPANETAAIRWGAVVRDVSRTGLGLTLCFPFKPGTYLAVHLHDREGKSLTLLGRVVHVREQGKGSWHLGCELLAPLTDAEVQDLLN